MREREIAARYKNLADHRRQQLDDLHTLLVEHNRRVEADLAQAQFYQTKIEELQDYISEEMADRDAVCLDINDAERLHKLWNDNSSDPP